MPVTGVSNLEAQRLYDGVELVSRVGDRSQRQLCVMSLVALMAGERHSDRPDCACAVITAYAIKLNDALDDSSRQRLKPFAPRIIGTRDGYEAERARFLVGSILNDVVPRLIAQRGGDSRQPDNRLRFKAGEPPHDAARRLTAAVREAGNQGLLTASQVSDLRYLLRAYGRQSHELVATASAVLLANCARLNATPRDARWFRNYATHLLDRACDVGISGIRSAADIERMSQQAASELQVSALRKRFARSRHGRFRALFGSTAGNSETR